MPNRSCFSGVGSCEMVDCGCLLLNLWIDSVISTMQLGFMFLFPVLPAETFINRLNLAAHLFTAEQIITEYSLYLWINLIQWIPSNTTWNTSRNQNVNISGAKGKVRVDWVSPSVFMRIHLLIVDMFVKLQDWLTSSRYCLDVRSCLTELTNFCSCSQKLRHRWSLESI